MCGVSLVKKTTILMASTRHQTTFLLRLLLLLLFSASTSFSQPEIIQRSFRGSIQLKAGVKCTRMGHRCVTNATCVNKQCVCPPGQFGNGDIECVPKGSHLCYLWGDPHISSYNRATADISLPCRYRLTRYAADVKDPTFRSTSGCSVEVQATNELYNGHYYVRNIHVSIGVTDHFQQEHRQYEFLKEGVSNQSFLQYDVNMTGWRTSWGYTEVEVSGVHVITSFDFDNNFAVLTVPECGTRIKFRSQLRTPYRHDYLPGVTIMAPPFAMFTRDFGAYPRSLCGAPGDKKTLYQDRAKFLGLHSNHLAVIYDVLSMESPQINNPQAHHCTAAFQAFSQSTSKVVDLNICGPIMTSPRATVCLTKAGLVPIEVFARCLRYLQRPVPADCQRMRNARAACQSRWPGPSPASCTAT